MEKEKTEEHKNSNIEEAFQKKEGNIEATTDKDTIDDVEKKNPEERIVELERERRESIIKTKNQIDVS